MSAGGLEYFMNVYINLRVLRETLKCKLPIELFYQGSNEMSATAASYLEKTFEDVKVIDLMSLSDFPANKPDLKGFDCIHSCACSG
jgi:hypothetical protein